MVLSGASRRAKASAVAMSHWSMSALIGSSRTRMARIGILPSWGRPSANWRRSRVESSSSSHRDGRSSRVTPCRPSGGTTWLPGGRCPPSMTSRMCGVGGRSSAPKRGRSLRSGGSRLPRSLDRGGDQPHRADRVDLARALGVRQPLDPVPVGEVLLRAEHRDDELLGVVEGGGRADHRPGRGAGLVLGAADLDPVEGAQVDGGRQVGLHAGARRAAGAAPTRRPGRPGRPARSPAAPARSTAAASRGRSARAGSWRRPDRAPTAGCAPRPAPAARSGSGWCQLSARRCCVGGVARHLADVGEVAEVLGARAGHLLRPLLTLPVDLHDDEAEGGEEEHAGREEAAASCWPPPPMVATSTIEPRLPSIGIAFIRTPLAPSLSWISGGGWSTIWPPGISGSSSRCPPRSVVLTRVPLAIPEWSR